MNSVANGKIRRMTPFRRVYVQSAAGDAGGAIGAAFAVWHERGGKRSFVMDHAYWGPQFGTGEVTALLAEQAQTIRAAGCTIEEIDDEGELCRRTATADRRGQGGRLVPGADGVGPARARQPLHRLRSPPRRHEGHPQRQDQAARIVPPVRAVGAARRRSQDWFEEDDAVPFMMQVFQIREEKRKQIPAVTHVDGTGRLQTVSRETNPRYHRLIESFRDLTGVPMVLNTTFNENEPVVCKPEEALDCFLRTKMDMLVLGNAFITRNDETR